MSFASMASKKRFTRCSAGQFQNQKVRKASTTTVTAAPMRKLRRFMSRAGSYFGASSSVIIGLHRKQFCRDYPTAPPWLLHTVGVLFLFMMAIERQLNQPRYQFRIRDTGGGPQFGIHADGSEAGHGIDLVHVDALRLAGIHQEIHARKAGTVA